MKPPVFSCLASHRTNTGSFYGQFLFGPLPVDISLTIATILRRSLLHTLAPFTIVSAEIEGADHEYAALPGIQESVLEILLNLGEIVLTGKKGNLLNPSFKSSCENKYLPTKQIYIASLKISGPCVVTAKDINWPDGIYCVKPDTHIATLSSNNTLALRIKILSSFKNKPLLKSQSKENARSYQGSLPNYVRQTKYFTDIFSSLSENSCLKQLLSSFKSLPWKAQRPLVLASLAPQGAKEASTGITKKPFSCLTSSYATATLVQTNLTTNKKKVLQSSLARRVNNTKVNDRYRIHDVPPFNKGFLKFSKLVAKQNVYTRLSLGWLYEKRKVGVLPPKTQKNYSATPLSFLKTQKYTPVLNQEAILRNSQNKANIQARAVEDTKLLSLSTLKRAEYLNKVISSSERGRGVNPIKDLKFTSLYNAHFWGLKKLRKPRAGKKNKNVVSFSPKTYARNYANLVKSESFQPLNLSVATSKSSVNFSVKPDGVWGKQLDVLSSFYPVEKVNFVIERDDQLMGHRHRIIFEIWTNGSISPRQAVFDSISWIIKILYNFRESTF